MRPLDAVLVHPPGAAFGRAFDNPAHGFRHPVDLLVAQREHEAYCNLLIRLGVDVHVLEVETDDPDLVYTFDPLLLTDVGAIPLRPGKPNRAGEPAVVEAWLTERGVPVVGRIEAPGTIEGGDVAWLRSDVAVIGRSLRTNDAGASQLAELLAALLNAQMRVVDLPYWRGPDELVHLLSVISPLADDLAVVYPPLLPAGLHGLLTDLGIRTIPVPDDEFETLGCNVLAIRAGVVVVAEGNPVTRQLLEAAGCEVHAYPATEIGLNGSGGPTCLALPIPGSPGHTPSEPTR